MTGIVTIAAPPASSALTTLDNAKAELGVTGTADDALIGRLIDRASSIVAAACGGRVFGSQTVSEAFRITPHPHVWHRRHIATGPLILSHVPATTLSTVTEDGTDLTTDDYEADLPAGLIWRLRFGCRSHWCVEQVTVAYTAGYVLPGGGAVSGVPALPPAVEDAALALIRSAYAARGADPSVVYELTEGVGRTQYNVNRPIGGMALDDGLRAQLAPFARRVF